MKTTQDAEKEDRQRQAKRRKARIAEEEGERGRTKEQNEDKPSKTRSDDDTPGQHHKAVTERATMTYECERAHNGEGNEADEANSTKKTGERDKTPGDKEQEGRLPGKTGRRKERKEGRC